MVRCPAVHSGGGVNVVVIAGVWKMYVGTIVVEAGEPVAVAAADGPTVEVVILIAKSRCAI